MSVISGLTCEPFLSMFLSNATKGYRTFSMSPFQPVNGPFYEQTNQFLDDRMSSDYSDETDDELDSAADYFFEHTDHQNDQSHSSSSPIADTIKINPVSFSSFVANLSPNFKFIDPAHFDSQYYSEHSSNGGYDSKINYVDNSYMGGQGSSSSYFEPLPPPYSDSSPENDHVQAPHHHIPEAPLEDESDYDDSLIVHDWGSGRFFDSQRLSSLSANNQTNQDKNYIIYQNPTESDGHQSNPTQQNHYQETGHADPKLTIEPERGRTYDHVITSDDRTTQSDINDQSSKLAPFEPKSAINYNPNENLTFEQFYTDIPLGQDDILVTSDVNSVTAGPVIRYADPPNPADPKLTSDTRTKDDLFPVFNFQDDLAVSEGPELRPTVQHESPPLSVNVGMGGFNDWYDDYLKSTGNLKVDEPRKNETIPPDSKLSVNYAGPASSGNFKFDLSANVQEIPNNQPITDKPIIFFDDNWSDSSTSSYEYNGDAGNENIKADNLSDRSTVRPLILLPRSKPLNYTAIKLSSSNWDEHTEDKTKLKDNEDGKDFYPHQYNIEIRKRIRTTVKPTRGPVHWDSEADKDGMTVHEGRERHIDKELEDSKYRLLEHKEEEHWHEKKWHKEGLAEEYLDGIALPVEVGPSPTRIKETREEATARKNSKIPGYARPMRPKASRQEIDDHFAIPSPGFRVNRKFVDWVKNDVGQTVS